MNTYSYKPTAVKKMSYHNKLYCTVITPEHLLIKLFCLIISKNLIAICNLKNLSTVLWMLRAMYKHNKIDLIILKRHQCDHQCDQEVIYNLISTVLFWMCYSNTLKTKTALPLNKVDFCRWRQATHVETHSKATQTH